MQTTTASYKLSIVWNVTTLGANNKYYLDTMSLLAKKASIIWNLATPKQPKYSLELNHF